MNSIYTVLISGGFGVLVALVTWKLADYKDRRKLNVDLKIKGYNDRQELYISIIASLEKAIRRTRRDMNFEDLFDEMSTNSAKLKLIGNKEINVQMDVVSDSLYSWSTAYKKALPTKVPGTTYGIISNRTIDEMEDAKSLYPPLMEEIHKLIELINKELEALEKLIKF